MNGQSWIYVYLYICILIILPATLYLNNIICDIF